MATVFILQDKTWIERGSGLVRFVFDLRTFALRLVIRPGTPDEFECKLRPRIRSKGPRAYVVRAQAENGTDEHILAVRFEREEDSRSFRRFVEKRDVDHNQKNHAQSNQNVPNNYPAQLRNQPDYANNPAAQQQQYRYQQSQARGSANIGGQGGYGGYPASSGHAMRNNNMYNSNTALGMYTNPNAANMNNVNMPSATNLNKYPVQANYFWTCSRCRQMVDPSLSSCHVCGTLRDPNPSANAQYDQAANPLQQMSSNPNAMNPYNQHAHNLSHGHHASYGVNNGAQFVANQAATGLAASGGQHSGHQQSATHATYGSHHQINPSSMTPSNRAHINNVNPYGVHPAHSASHGGGAQPVVSPPNVHILKLTTVNLEKHNKLFPPKRRNVKEIIHAQLEYLRTHQ